MEGLNVLVIDVRIIVSDVIYGKSEIFSKDETPDIYVAEAVRMSMSIPVFYIPYNYKSSLYVDGGIMNNFPLVVFNNSKRPNLGLQLVEKKMEGERNIKNLLDYLTTLVDIFISVNEQLQIELSHSHIISIPTGDIGVTDFSLSNEKKNFYII